MANKIEIIIDAIDNSMSGIASAVKGMRALQSAAGMVAGAVTTTWRNLGKLVEGFDKVSDEPIADQLTASFKRANSEIEKFKMRLVEDAAPAIIIVLNDLAKLVVKVEEGYVAWQRLGANLQTWGAIKAGNNAIIEEAVGLWREETGNINLTAGRFRQLAPEIQETYIAQAKLNVELEKTKILTGGATTGLHNFAQRTATLTEAGKKAFDAARALDELKQSADNLSKVSFVISFSAQAENFEKNKKDILAKMEEVKNEILAMEDSWRWSDKEKLPGLREELTGLTGELNESEAAFKKWQKQAIFSLIQTKMAADGLTDVEFDQLMNIGEELGVLDPAIVDQATTMLDAISSVDSSQLEDAAKYLKYMVDHDGQKITIYVEQVITETQGVGGGTDSLPIGASGGGTNNTTNNYFYDPQFVVSGIDGGMLAGLTE